jgi:CRP/FNR family cyclic AMP-dependent transcriptional regulator
MAVTRFLFNYQPIRRIAEITIVSRIRQKTDESQLAWDASGVRLIDRKNNSLMIDPELLRKYGAKEIVFKKDETVFLETQEALSYFQIVKGSIKMMTYSAEGKEFIQGIFKINDSFGEPPLLCGFPYPSSAITLEPTTLIKLAKHKFLTLLQENFEIHLHLDRVLCERLKYKSMVLSEIASHDPEHRIASLLRHLKGGGESLGTANGRNTHQKHDFIVPFTRQQIADMTGLRVETVIRTVKKMEDDGKLRVVSRKIAY